ncbi:anti-sigma factor [uncultured Erythrobacter sp.]|uniref:anti-sigma factor n=1 Tax=uncultured Erythrobacter sp. TaxID=263913 RepID=UPI0026110870|nr:anti-sigma factor [uncultured Erythrobacter sp.]
MSTEDTPFDDRERDDAMKAAEHALGLLEGEELLASRGKAASDPEYAARKAWWNNWFAPWTDEVAPAEPSDAVWARIEAQINGSQPNLAANDDGDIASNVVDLASRLRRWQWTAGITSAAAALMLAVMVFSPGGEPRSVVPSTNGTVLAAANPLIAQVPIGDTGLRLDVTYIPESERLLVGAIGLIADGVHDHELWLVPADGSALQSLGVVVPGEVLSQELAQEIAANMGDGVGLVLTREPIGGKPEGVDAGPVVAEGAFNQV